MTPRAPKPQFIVALTACIALGACSRPSDPALPGAAPPQDGVAPGAASPDGSAAAGGHTGAATEAAGRPAGRGPASAAAVSSATEPPPLPNLMTRLGFESDGTAALDDFVHLPPGATGESGEFRRGTDTVRVALIRYPNPRFAAPHVTDIDERRRVLPHPHEAVASYDRFVVHIVARDLETADAVARQASDALGWTSVDAPAAGTSSGEGSGE